MSEAEPSCSDAEGCSFLTSRSTIRRSSFGDTMSNARPELCSYYCKIRALVMLRRSMDSLRLPHDGKSTRHWHIGLSVCSGPLLARPLCSTVAFCSSKIRWRRLPGGR